MATKVDSPEYSIEIDEKTLVQNKAVKDVDDMKKDIKKIKDKLKKDKELEAGVPVAADEDASPTIAPESVVNDPAQLLAINIAPGGALSTVLKNPIINDKLVESLSRGTSTMSTLDVIMREIAEEAAYVKAYREENWGKGEDLSESTFRRIKMLQALVETLVEKERIKKDKDVGKIDFFGDNFQNVLKYFLEITMKVFRDINIPTQFEDIFVTELARNFDGFEKKAEKIYYGKK